MMKYEVYAIDYQGLFIPFGETETAAQAKEMVSNIWRTRRMEYAEVSYRKI